MQNIIAVAPPTTTTFPIQFSPDGSWQSGVRTVEVDNGSALTLSVYADGQLIRTVGPYISRFNLNTAAGWQQIRITANDATIQATDSVTIVFYDQAVTPPLLPAFGVSSWGAGAIPNALVAVNPGDQIMAWQVQQLVNLLTGVMTGQQLKLANELVLLDPSTNTVKRLVALPDGANSYLAIRNNADTANLILMTPDQLV